MSDTEDIEDIRREKRAELQDKLDGDGAGGGVAGDGATGEDAGAGATSDGSGAGRAPTEPVHVESGDHLQELTEGNQVVLVDYYADWCGPCRMLEPVVEEIAAKTPAAVAKVDIDVHQHLAQQAGVRGVPTMLLFADGEPVERLVGVQDQATLEQLVEQYAA